MAKEKGVRKERRLRKKSYEREYGRFKLVSLFVNRHPFNNVQTGRRKIGRRRHLRDFTIYLVTQSVVARRVVFATAKTQDLAAPPLDAFLPNNSCCSVNNIPAEGHKRLDFAPLEPFSRKLLQDKNRTACGCRQGKKKPSRNSSMVLSKAPNIFFSHSFLPFLPEPLLHSHYDLTQKGRDKIGSSCEKENSKARDNQKYNLPTAQTPRSRKRALNRSHFIGWRLLLCYCDDSGFLFRNFCFKNLSCRILRLQHCYFILNPRNLLGNACLSGRQARNPLLFLCHRKILVVQQGNLGL